MGVNPSRFKEVGPTAPVEEVSWDDAMKFCKMLTLREKEEKRLPKGYEYTLPTEAQWEYACRVGTTSDYAGNLASMGWYNSNRKGTNHPVANLKPNQWDFMICPATCLTGALTGTATTLVGK